MARHDQKPDKRLMTCTNCKKGKCEECVDVLRAVYSDEMVCECIRKNHSGDPSENQIVDPFTQSVHGPGAEITVDGEVIVDEQFKRDFVKLYSTE